MTFRSINDDISMRFQAEVRDTDWRAVFQADRLDKKVEMFNKLLMKCMDLHAPLQSRTFKNLPALWLTADIKKAMYSRDKARRKWRVKGDSASYYAFKKLRNHIQELVRTAKRQYYQAEFSEIRDSDTVWSRLGHLGLVRAGRIHRRLPCGVDELNSYFASIAGTGGGQNECESPELIGSIFDDSNLHWSYVSPDLISKIFRRIKSDAVGFDGIPLKFIKLTLPYLLPVYEHIFNFSLQHSVYPHRWKLSVVCLVLKVRNPVEVEHYRPIAILPVVSKALERVVCDQIKAYLEHTDRQDPCQAAYKRGHSTQTCLIRWMK